MPYLWLKGSGRSREVREKNCVWHYTESEEACQHDQYHIVTRGICRNGYGINREVDSCGESYVHWISSRLGTVGWDNCGARQMLS